MIFNNQIVALKLPEDVCIALNNLKSVTVKKKLQFLSQQAYHYKYKIQPQVSFNKRTGRSASSVNLN